MNAQRRLLTSQVYEAAEKQLSADADLLSEPVILLTNPNWPGGVVGIVANKVSAADDDCVRTELPLRRGHEVDAEFRLVLRDAGNTLPRHDVDVAVGAASVLLE